jgi:hypothetical protein
MESRKERFNRIATKRTNDIIDKIRVLGNCSNRSTYDYTEDEINKIFSAINKELRISKDRFTSKRKKFIL